MLVKAPVPVPSLVVLLAVVGFCIVPKAMPLAVTVEPPSEVTLPPVVALEVEICDTEVVVNTGSVAGVVKLI
jgi:hypothetical protein